MARRGRKPFLTDALKRDVVTILAVGCTRRAAAAYVGCTPRTIRNTAARDPEFAEQLRAAEGRQELTYLTRIHEAAIKPQYWRAAAWFLEHRLPDIYGRRKPDSVSRRQAVDLLQQFAEILTEEIPVARYRKGVLQRVELMIESLGESVFDGEAKQAQVDDGDYDKSEDDDGSA